MFKLTVDPSKKKKKTMIKCKNNIRVKCNKLVRNQND